MRHRSKFSRTLVQAPGICESLDYITAGVELTNTLEMLKRQNRMYQACLSSQNTFNSNTTDLHLQTIRRTSYQRTDTTEVSIFGLQIAETITTVT